MPHKSGITTRSKADVGAKYGRKTCPTNRGLRPSLRDPTANTSSRKTCPTNRGLRRYRSKPSRITYESENLPHKSGITTATPTDFDFNIGSENLPHKSGITTKSTCFHCLDSLSENLPHKSGITTRNSCNKRHRWYVGKLAPQIGDYDIRSGAEIFIFLRRKTCPTNRGLRQVSGYYYDCNNESENLPHKSGITTKTFQSP